MNGMETASSKEQLIAILGITAVNHGLFIASLTVMYLAVIAQMGLNGSSFHCPKAA